MSLHEKLLEKVARKSCMEKLYGKVTSKSCTKSRKVARKLQRNNAKLHEV